MTGDSGAHPIRPPGEADDMGDMTVLAATHDIRPGRFARVATRPHGTGRHARDDSATDPAREMKMRDVRARIERDSYDIDPHAVAEAIVARLLAGGTAAPGGPQCS